MKQLVHGLMAFLMTMTMGAAMAADLQLGPGDVLKVSVYGSPDLTLEARVSEGGNISFPLIGQVPVAGLSAAAAEKKIASMLEAGNFVKKPQVNVIVTAVQSQQVSVLGQVNRPGRYPIEGKRSLIDLLAMAGGINGEGGDRVSLIRTRDGKTTREEIDVIEMVRAGQLSKDYALSGNDVLYVERAPKFYIYGEVQRPGAFRLERAMTVVQALSAGGGLSMRGTERGLVIKRRDADGKIRLIDAKQDDMLQVDDVVFVKESWF
ncbi:polysaccharide export protein EpsE [Massilia sp. DJPM01]|uniref:polysaccharide export protein EpsE n=1 Tax=Massilia sp. DJPM01 TaxID=3024404 RepID=UPI00259D6B72|nr:polysaccharide export protein EpsE [Massilia sp. DJPM01]MDM5179393.1 polysaccharide export protein EpsE [Massilia sp. DJPM01]